MINVQKILDDLYIKDNFKELTELNPILGNDIFIISDYIENGKRNNFSVYSFLVTDDNELLLHSERLNQFRELNRIPENSFFDFKKVFQDKQRKRLLPDYLEIIDQMKGYLFTLVINKEVVNNFSKDTLIEHFEAKGFGKWKPHILAEMILTFSVYAFLASKIKNTNILWLSDEDSRFGNNESQQKNSIKFLELFLLNQKIPKPKRIYLQCDSKEKKFYQDRDLKSIVDLATGSINDCIDNPEKVRDISLDYYRWFNGKPVNLNRNTFQIYLKENSISVQKTTMIKDTSNNLNK
ncbi:hypothetical protein MM236_18010 [Belliella sp. DSM 107340]|uniref:DUF4263 domain-containing protein n=1 Tax=Belliella calami TaxID=2923436 RepID=A0ABS9UUL9_9BACT|nr:hypothetical protein [Belliella calami]MCH7399895.1 hypothetical protein [Belliella calami]